MEITIRNFDRWIRISESHEGGHYYEMYDVNPDLPENENVEEIDGGLCTGTDSDALTMAMLQAGAMLPDSQFAPVCEDCGTPSREYSATNHNPTCPDCDSDNILMVITE